MFRIPAAALKLGLFGRVSDRDHHACYQNPLHCFPSFFFHDSRLSVVMAKIQSNLSLSNRVDLSDL